MNITDGYVYRFEDFYYIQAFYNVKDVDDIIDIADNLINSIINNYDNSYLHYINDSHEDINNSDYLDMDYIIALESQGDSIFPGKASLIKINKLNLNEMSKLSTDGNFIIFGDGDILKLMKFIENKNFNRSDLLRLIIKYDFNVISFVDHFSFMMILKNKSIVERYFSEYMKDMKILEERVVNLQFKEQN